MGLPSCFARTLLSARNSRPRPRACSRRAERPTIVCSCFGGRECGDGLLCRNFIEQRGNLSALVRVTRGARATAGPDDQSSPTASLVAVVEDDDDIRAALADLLGEEGYRVLPYASADHALRDMQIGRRPDLILLDLMMPGMNGWQFRVEQLRRTELAEIPVIVLSADASAYAAAIDADAYVKKPIDADRLCAVVGQVLLAAERRRLAAKAIELERMRSLGMLVASVAHEINNPLTYVTGHIELALMRARELGSSRAASTPSTQQFVANMESALDGVQRIAHIVRLLSTFARADTQEAQRADVLRAVDAASRLAMHQLARRARLVCHLTPASARARQRSAARTGFSQSLGQRRACDPRGSGRAPRGPSQWPHAGRNGDCRGRRRRLRHRTRADSSHLRAVLHDQTLGARNWARSQHLARYCDRCRRLDLGEQCARKRHDLSHRASDRISQGSRVEACRPRLIGVALG